MMFKPVSVWVPIEELSVRENLPFGIANIAILTRVQIDDALNKVGATRSTEHDNFGNHYTINGQVELQCASNSSRSH